MRKELRRTHLAAPLLVAIAALVISPQAAQAAGKYDGDWVGVPNGQANNNPDCPSWKAFRLRIVDGKFNQDVGRAPMQGGIAPDGSFSASGNWQARRAGVVIVQFAGRVTGDQLNAVYHTQYCTFNMALHRQ